jgi:hypothetical protein
VGLPEGRYERLHAYADEDPAGLLPLLQRHMDLVLVAPGQGWRELAPVYTAPDAHGRPAILLRVPREPLRYEGIEGPSLSLTVSQGRGVAAMHDGDLATSWSSGAALRGGEWVQAVFPDARPLGRLVLLVARAVDTYDPELEVFTSPDGQHFDAVAAVSARPPLRDQDGRGHPLGQELLLRPRPVRGVRIVQRGARPYPWEIAEIRLEARRRE